MNWPLLKRMMKKTQGWIWGAALPLPLVYYVAGGRTVLIVIAVHCVIYPLLLWALYKNFRHIFHD